MAASEGSVFLETDQLIFRSHESRDETAFIAMQTDPEVRRYVGGRAWAADEAVERFRRQYLGKPRQRYGLWATVVKAENQYVGFCGLAGSRDSAHLGYYLARPYWARGLASEAARAFVDVGFGKFGLAIIRADVERGNLRSERILESLGFVFAREETLASGRIIDHYELLNSISPVPISASPSM